MIVWISRIEDWRRRLRLFFSDRIRVTNTKWRFLLEYAII